MPVGDVPRETLLQCTKLVTKHRQVELQLLRSFYKEQQKSPFKFLPWKNGFMHFRFLAVRGSLVLGVWCDTIQVPA